MINLLCCEQFDHTTSLFLSMALINFGDLPYHHRQAAYPRFWMGGAGGGGGGGGGGVLPSYHTLFLLRGLPKLHAGYTNAGTIWIKTSM